MIFDFFLNHLFCNCFLCRSPFASYLSENRASVPKRSIPTPLRTAQARPASAILEEARAQVNQLTSTPIPPRSRSYQKRSSASKSAARPHHLAPSSGLTSGDNAPAHALNASEQKVKEMYQGSINRMATQAAELKQKIAETAQKRAALQQKFQQSQQTRAALIAQAEQETREFEAEMASIRTDFETKAAEIHNQQQAEYEEIARRHAERNQQIISSQTDEKTKSTQQRTSVKSVGGGYKLGPRQPKMT